MKWQCDLCGWIYDEAQGDPDNGIAAGTQLKDLPDSWSCSICGASKDQFSPAK